LRRIKSVSLRIPCVLGPHTSLNCTLRLLKHKFRINAIANGKSDYPEQTDKTDERFSTVNVPISSIAVSSVEDESGVFELNFHDERYLPFEGAGVVSRWRIQLPDKFRQFDYDTMTDVVIRLRYTSVDGGDKLKQPASDSVLDYVRSAEDLSRDEGLFTAFDLKNDFSDAWYTANHPAPAATERVFTIDKLNEKLPIFTKGRIPSKIRATDMYLFASGSLPPSAFTATQGGNDITFKDGPSLGTPTTLKCYAAEGVDSAMDSLQLKIGDVKTPIDKMWLMERYTLT
jgi:Tc toxin complex TcA C-terminal TcB-binding domain